jgi:pimeloyl-ACP methyl ester carboxylesterase
VSDEKVYGGYTMLDQSAAATTQPTSPTGNSNASVVLEGPPDVQGSWKLTIPSSVAFWQVNPGSPDTSVGNGQASATVTLAPTVPLKMQGLTASSSERDTSLKCTFTESSPTSFTMYDTAKATVASVEVLDAKAFGPQIGGGITAPKETGGQGTMPMQGAWADGVSVLVVRMKPNVNAAIAATFQLGHTNPNFLNDQSASYVGSLTSSFPTLPAGSQSTSVTFGQNGSKAMFYCPPMGYLFDYNLSTQQIDVTGNVGGLNAQADFLQLKRPSAILIHGFDSDSTALAKMAEYLTGLNSTLDVYPLDWSPISLNGLDDAATMIAGKIKDHIAQASNAGIAATRADVFAHSMGGMSCWWYMSNFGAVKFNRRAHPWRPFETYGTDFSWNSDGQSLLYLRPANFGQGDIGQFATAGTLYLGSPWANYLYDYWPRPIATLAFGLTGGHGNGNCFADLRVDRLGFSGLAFLPGAFGAPPYRNEAVERMAAPNVNRKFARADFSLVSRHSRSG